MGFSLTELLVVITILGVLTTLAVLQFRTSKTDFERQRIAREFKVYLERARFDSVKRRAVNTNDMAKITLNSANLFTVAIDFNGDGKLDAADIRTVDFTQRSDTKIVVSDSLNYPITITFNQRGQVIAKDNLGNDVTPLFTICSKNCTGGTQNNEDLTVLSVSSTGTVAVLKGGQSPSALTTPAVTNSTPQLNCYVLIINSNSNTASCSVVY